MKKLLLLSTLAFGFTAVSLPAFSCDCEKGKKGGKAMTKKDHADCKKCKLAGKKTCACDMKKDAKETDKASLDKEAAPKDGDAKTEELKSEHEGH